MALTPLGGGVYRITQAAERDLRTGRYKQTETCSCGVFASCPADKTGLCWKDAERATINADLFDQLMGEQ